MCHFRAKDQSIFNAPTVESSSIGALDFTDMTDRAKLIRSGFSPVHYEGQDGEFLAKKLRLQDMPRAAAQLVDDDTFFSDMEVITKVMPDGRVHFLILEVDYVEGPVALDSPDARMLLDDSGLID